MDSDDDYHSFSLRNESSPQVQYQRLKRLKKSKSEPPKQSLKESINDPLLFPLVDYAKLEALENDSETLDFNDSMMAEEPFTLRESQFDGSDDEEENGLGNQKEKEFNFEIDAVVKKTKRVLEFNDDLAAASDDEENELANQKRVNFEVDAEINTTKRALEFDDLTLDSKKKGSSEGDIDETKAGKKKKKKKLKGDTTKESSPKLPVSNKRREEKERKAYLQQLHAESQKLLRETRDAAFKPIPVVQKPISSVLEKIRKRKLEVSKSKNGMLNNEIYASEGNGSQRDQTMEVDLVNIDSGMREAEKGPKTVENEAPAQSIDAESSPRTSEIDGSEDSARQTSHDNIRTKVTSEAAHELPTPTFRAPIDDTQDLFDDSQPSDNKAEQPDERKDSPLEEDFAPSLLAMNLKFDSAPVDDSSSDEEDNDKENVDPHPCGIANGSSSPKGDPVKDFVDDEAEEEDDSDNDLNRFEENEDEDTDDFEELNDMIATECEDRTIDKERRDELHQKWLEQQDAAGTDNLLQRLKCGSKLRETILNDKEPESDNEDEEEYDDEDKEDVLRKSARLSSKDAKEIILRMFSDKEDAFLSDDDDTEKRHVKQRLLIKAEKETTVGSPADDESSREVFGLIKKLNIVSDNKKKPKASSFFETSLKGGKSNCSSKTLLHLHQNEYSGCSSSFLGRASKLHVPPSNKQGSGMVRSFVFGRDDSNSRSSVLLSDDASDAITKESRQTRNGTAKFSNSQSKLNSQNGGDTGAEKASNTSLFEILKRSSSESHVCNQDSVAELPKSMFASFRIPTKKPMKVEGRS